MCTKAATFHIKDQALVCPDENDQILESPVSSSLSDAILKASQSKGQMDEFLRQQSQSYYERDDDDNMSTELRMLKGSEEKLRRDMERIEIYMNLPQLAHVSDCESEESSENSISSQCFDDNNVCRKLYGSFNEVMDIEIEIPDLEMGNSEQTSGSLCNDWNRSRREGSDCDNLVDMVSSILYDSSKSSYTNHAQLTFCVLGSLLFLLRSIVQ